MSKRGGLMRGPRIRRAVQIVFLLLFVGLVVAARSAAGAAPSPLVESFFLLDPLILVATWLSAHAVSAEALWALAVLAITVALGRVFCGWVCPLGTVHDASGRVFDRWQKNRKARDHWSPWQRTKYYLLIGLLAMAVFGGHWLMIFDPLVLLYRTLVVALMPGFQWAVEEGSTAVYQADPGIGPLRLAAVTEPVYGYLRDNVFTVAGQAFLGSTLIAALFIGLLLLNGYRRRFWCRYLCPLGGLLGFFSKRPLLCRVVDEEACNQCDLCGMSCHGAAAEEAAKGWKPSECLGCLNCTDRCPRTSVRFTFNRRCTRQLSGRPVGLTRRGALGAAAGGVAALALLRATPQGCQRRYNQWLVRPPGSLAEGEFLRRCTACGVCMKICPTGGLNPAVGEAGLEGLWTPRLVSKIGYCDYTCTLCGQVCPTGAIEPLTVETKQQTKIGLASFDTSRCLPYAYGRECIVCEEHCPIPDKAIYAVEVEIVDHQGQPKTIKQPRVDPDKCIGCGICENKCVFSDRPAIRVFSANEARHPRNQPILPESDLPY